MLVPELTHTSSQLETSLLKNGIAVELVDSNPSGDCLGLELDRQRGVERIRDAPQDRQRRGRSAGLEPGARRLGHTRELRQFALASAPLLAHAPHLLP